jgi:penicillin-binding protein 1B
VVTWWSPPSRRLRLIALGLGLIVVVPLLGLVTYSSVELRRFEQAQTRRTTLVYAAPLPLAPGINVRLLDLAGTLTRLNYHETRGAPSAPGQFHRAGAAWDIFLRGTAEQGAAQRVKLDVRDDRVVRVTRQGQNIGAVALEPEVLTSAGDRPGESARPVRLADVPLTLLNAILAAEDHRFFEHGGLDARGLARAAWANFRSGRVTQGGSTITQQLIKNRLLSPKRTLWRKVREAWLATLIEWRYPKEQILEAYLNEVYLGQRGTVAIRGVGAAARAYFGKEIHQLTLGEAALVAGMVRAPNSYSPAVSPQRARERRDVVLGRLRELGRISAADYEAARKEPVRVQALAASGQAAPYFADFVRLELEQRFGDDVALTRGVRVFTTLDLALQRFADSAVVRGLDRLETRLPALRRAEDARRLQAALVALDPETGQIRALVGGRSYQTSQFNRVVLARRQPGSAFKPFVFLTALRPRSGPPAFTAASLVDDAPLVMTVGGQPWTPRNYQDRYEGRVTVRIALEHSLNSATVLIADAVGLAAVIDTAHALGLPGDFAAVPALALGAFEVTPLDLARAYLPFANGGMRMPAAVGVRSVLDPDGTVDGADETPERVISPAESYLMTSLLEGVIKEGTAAEARALGVPGAIAGKTGTTNDARDAWFVGYAPGLLTAVWVGFDDNEPHGLSGAQAALPIWSDFMRQALEAYPQRGFTVPGGVEFADIDATNGRRANRFCPVVLRETFLSGTVPEPCQDHGGLGDQVRDWWSRLRDWMRR